MDRFVKLLCFLNFFTVAFGDHVIHSPVTTDFGTWGDWEYCVNSTAVTGFQLKVEPKNSLVDDTGLNGIRLFCGPQPKDQSSDANVINSPDSPPLIWENVTSSVGIFGYWGEIFTCPTYAIGFDLEVVPPRGNYRDDKGATNMKLICAGGTELVGFVNNGNQHVFEGAVYTGPQKCTTGYAVCGIQTQVEEYQTLGDDTGLNNVNMKCCPVTAFTRP